MQNPIHYPTMATVKNAAVRFNVTPTYVRKLCRTGKIRYTAISCRRWLVNMDSLAQFFAEGEPVRGDPAASRRNPLCGSLKKGRPSWLRSSSERRRMAPFLI